MAQGTMKSSRSSSSGSRRKESRKKISLASQKNKEARPKKPRSEKHRNIKDTKLVHRNIERLAVAKAMKYDGNLRIGELNVIGKKQLKVETVAIQKKVTKTEKMEISIRKATNKLQKN